MLGDVTPPRQRLRRLRASKGLRSLVRETRVSPAELIQPIFVQEGLQAPRPIDAMPGCSRLGVRDVEKEAATLYQAGVGGIILFGLPATKTPDGSGAYDASGVVPRAVQAAKRSAPDLFVVTDVCLCEYTTSGHCGLVDGQGVDNDGTLPLLARTALAHARAGADLVAPSAMMDGQVAAIRHVLDANGFAHTPIMGYSAKHASGFYGPFREAADSTPVFGDRQTYQMDPANAREAMREIELDAAEGADAVLIKPGLPCLDILHAARQRFDLPLGAYQVSGEYAMIKAAAAQGWLEEERVVRETLVALRRAGADFIITYFAKQFAERTNGRSSA